MGRMKGTSAREVCIRKTVLLHGRGTRIDKVILHIGKQLEGMVLSVLPIKVINVGDRFLKYLM